jgi:hypothetical protein
VYQLVDGAWTQLGGDIDGEDYGDHSGCSVSLSADGNRVAIGAYRNWGGEGWDGGYEKGHVRVYQFASGAWTQLGQDIDGEAAGDYSGYSVSLSADGTIVAIGAEYNDGNGTDSGHVRVYQRDESEALGWKKLGEDIDGKAAGDRSGYSVSLSADGSIVAIGAYQNDGNGSNSGHVRVYQYSNDTWGQVGLDIDGEAADDWSGYSVSLSADGSIVAIGAIHNVVNGAGSGHVRVYQFTSGAWTKLGQDIDGEAQYDKSGWSVSLSADGNSVAIGAIGIASVGDNKMGHVRVYQVRAPLYDFHISGNAATASDAKAGSLLEAKINFLLLFGPATYSPRVVVRANNIGTSAFRIDTPTPQIVVGTEFTDFNAKIQPGTTVTFVYDYGNGETQIGLSTATSTLMEGGDILYYPRP